MIMDDLKEIYERIKFLRHKGVKMKEIASSTGFTPSVLSALFTTVMPAYFKNLDKGMPEDNALDEALIWVNNVSKKKLLGSLDKMKAALFAMEAVACGMAFPCLGEDDAVALVLGQFALEAVQFFVLFHDFHEAAFVFLQEGVLQHLQGVFQLVFDEEALEINH